MYDPNAWYWRVENKPDSVFSSAAAAYLPLADPGYAAWVAAGNLPSRIATDGELADVLTRAGAPGAAVRAAGGSDWGAVPVSDIAAALAVAGVALSSTGNPETSGAFAVAGTFGDGSDVTSTADGIYNRIKGGDGLPGGGSSFFYPDIAGAPHPFTADQFTAFYLFAGDYRYQLAQEARQPSPSWPANTKTIP